MQPRRTQPRDDIIKIRVTPAEKERLEQILEKLNDKGIELKLGTLMYQLALAAADDAEDISQWSLVYRKYLHFKTSVSTQIPSVKDTRGHKNHVFKQLICFVNNIHCIF